MNKFPINRFFLTLRAHGSRFCKNRESSTNKQHALVRPPDQEFLCF